MAKMIHSMIRVLDLEKSLRFYADVLDFKVARRLDFDDFTLVYLCGKGDFELELTCNKGRTEAYTHGSGYGHLAVVVDDLDARHARCVTLGYAPAPVKEFRPDGKTLLARFFFIEDADGYKVEILQRDDNYR